MDFSIGSQNDFPGGKSGEISFFPLETKQTFFAKNVTGK